MVCGANLCCAVCQRWLVPVLLGLESGPCKPSPSWLWVIVCTAQGQRSQLSWKLAAKMKCFMLGLWCSSAGVLQMRSCLCWSLLAGFADCALGEQRVVFPCEHTGSQAIIK